jgi:hypothetical protein
MYLYAKWNSSRRWFARQQFSPLKHLCVSLATSETEAYAAKGGAFRPQWREWPRTDYWANLVRAGSMANAAICNIYIASELPLNDCQDARKDCT